MLIVTVCYIIIYLKQESWIITRAGLRIRLGHELVGDGGEELGLVVLGGHHVGGLGLHREPLARRALLPASLGLGLANLVGMNWKIK